jgi:hypothetical protein
MIAPGSRKPECTSLAYCRNMRVAITSACPRAQGFVASAKACAQRVDVVARRRKSVDRRACSSAAISAERRSTAAEEVQIG